MSHITRQSAWVVSRPDPAAVDLLSRRLKVSPVLAGILAARGHAEVTAARQFLHPSLNDLHEPDLLDGIRAAATRIQEAVVRHQRILLYGDYDVDGITAAALLWRLLRTAHADVRVYVPHRVDEGYGLNREAIESFAREGVQLLITVDCGVTAPEEVALAQRLGIDCIVTDHHEPDAALPQAVAVVDPKCRESTYPFAGLSGVGVAFKLAWAVAQQFSPGKKVSPPMREFLLDALGLVALGTVADVVPLVGENRVLTHFGLQALANSHLPGLRALLAVGGADGGTVSSHAVAYQLAPRLNAAGRVGHANLAVELFTTSDTARAQEIAAQLDALNRERQRTELQIFQQAQEAVAALPDLETRRSLVLADPRWHAGIIGIVASRLVSQWHRPVILIAAPDADGADALAQGSGRSIPGFDLFAALQACRERLVTCGGHEQAAGLRLRPADVPAFAEQFEAYCQATLRPEDLRPRLEIDALVGFEALTEDLVADLDRLGPFGQANRRPLLATTGVQVCGQPRRVGRAGGHLVLVLRHGAESRRAVGFGMGERLDEVEQLGPTCDVVYGPRLDRYAGGVELHLRDIAFPRKA